MRNAEEFDEFYVAGRRRLLLQTFALTGDLGAAKSAVRDAYVAARHHWNKVGRMAEPEDWVRPRAWANAQRRHSARLWHREKGITPEQVAVLEALHKLPDIERKTLLLTHLAALSMPEIGREIGETQARAEHHLQSATSSLALALDVDATRIRGHLDSLESALASTKLPRAPIIRRDGRNRRRSHAVAGSAVLVALTVLAGMFVASGKPPPPPVEAEDLVTESMLLGLPTARRLAPKQGWVALETTDNTQGSGINSRCQAARFADEQGLGTLVRSFRSTGRPMHRLVETVEISSSPGAAGKAYDTTVGWFAGCNVARLQLLRAYRIKGVGDEAQLLRLRIPDRQERSYLVAVARSGALTVSTLVETRGGRGPSVNSLARTLSASVRQLCGSDAADSCVGELRTVPVLPPPSGEAPGMLAVGDLPPIGKINRPWVGTRPRASSGSLAATICDRSNFRKAGARRAVTRSFLIPRSGLPERFGITQTIGRFPSEKGARDLVDQVKRRMSDCPDDKLGSEILDEQLVPDAYRSSQFALWRLQNQVNREDDNVEYWMGVAQVGPYVAQVTFTPVPGSDIDSQTFQSVLARARDRLFEVSTGRPGQ